MYDFLMNNSNYGPISHRFGDTTMYMLKITEFAYFIGAANDMGVTLV